MNLFCLELDVKLIQFNIQYINNLNIKLNQLIKIRIKCNKII